MVKTKQKKPSRKTFSKKRIALLIIGVFILLIGILVAVKIFEANKTVQDEKDLLIKALNATQVAYSRFSGEITNPKENTQSPVNECTRAGGKFSGIFNCGPSARLTVTDLDESQYLILNNKALDIYKASGYFELIGSAQPHDDGLDPGLTGNAGSRLSGADLRCYDSSNYRSEKKGATFNWGCVLVSKIQHFPLEN